MSKYRLIVIGASAGGLEAILQILTVLPKDFLVPIVIVQHQAPQNVSYFADILNKKIAMQVMDAEDKLSINDSIVYLAPAAYHLQIESDRSFSLSIDEPVHYSRPSIDVLFESAANVYKQALIGILLTGANEDGAEGIAVIQNQGGTILIQDPKTASSPEMPSAGIRLTNTTHIYSLQDIANQILRLTQGEKVMDNTKPAVLLVDDKEENIFSLKNILIDSDCTILTALSAAEGMDILKKESIACLLLDVHMPKVNGFEMAQQIRSDEKLKDTPIVFVTAVELGSDKVKRGYDLGALDYLIKPLNPNLVRTKVDLYCQLYRKTKEIEQLKYKK